MEQNSIFESNILPDLKQQITGSASWAKIAAIVSLVGAGLSLVTSISAGDFFTAVISTIITVVLNIFLLRYATNTLNGTRQNDQGLFIEGVEALRVYFKVSAIIMIIIVILVGIILLGSIAVGMMGAMK
jgi:hypothetical protein